MASDNGMKAPAEPFRVGIMVDIPCYPGFTDMFEAGCRFALEEAYENKRIDRPVEVVTRIYNGFPWGSGLNNREVYLDLVRNEKVMAICGPTTTDNCLSVLDTVEQEEVPVVTICGTNKFGGRYAFNVSNGSLADEPAYMASWLASQGHRKIAVIRDYPSKIGLEYSRFLEFACQLYGLEIVGVANINPMPLEEETATALKKLKASGADALAYLGMGAACRTFAQAHKVADWYPPRIMTTAFVSATYNRQCALDIDGWHGIDQLNENNPRTMAMLARYEMKHPDKKLVANTGTTCGYDIGTLIALGLARMEIPTPQGVADALETIRMLPAVTGGPNTYISFGHYDHRGYKGRDYLNVRKSVNGTTELVACELQNPL